MSEQREPSTVDGDDMTWGDGKWNDAVLQEHAKFWADVLQEQVERSRWIGQQIQAIVEPPPHTERDTDTLLRQAGALE